MFKTFKTAAMAGLIGLSALAAVPANADSIYLGLGDRHDDARVGVYLGDSGRMHYPHERDRYREREFRHVERRCNAERALDKAARIGVHRARIDYIDDESIGVRGRSNGDRVEVIFARAPGCPIIG